MFCGDVLIARWLNVPLCQSPFPLQDWNNVGQVWRRLLLLRRRRGTLFPITSRSRTEAITITAVSSPRSARTSIVKQVSVSSRWSFIIISSCVASSGAPIPVPIPFAPPPFDLCQNIYLRARAPYSLCWLNTSLPHLHVERVLSFDGLVSVTFDDHYLGPCLCHHVCRRVHLSQPVNCQHSAPKIQECEKA